MSDKDERERLIRVLDDIEKELRLRLMGISRSFQMWNESDLRAAHEALHRRIKELKKGK